MTMRSMLHRLVRAAEGHAEHEHIGAVFSTQEGATAAIGALREQGLGSDHLGVVIREPGEYKFEEDVEEDTKRDTLAGLGLGASVGAIAGLTVAALAVPGLGTIGVGGVLALGAASGFGGAAIGGLLGFDSDETEREEEEPWEALQLPPGAILVVACTHERPESVREILERGGGQVMTVPGGGR